MLRTLPCQRYLVSISRPLLDRSSLSCPGLRGVLLQNLADPTEVEYHPDAHAMPASRLGMTASPSRDLPWNCFYFVSQRFVGRGEDTHVDGGRFSCHLPAGFAVPAIPAGASSGGWAMEFTSSRKMVPPSASSNKPISVFHRSRKGTLLVSE